MKLSNMDEDRKRPAPRRRASRQQGGTQDYLDINRRTYDELVDQYASRVDADKVRDAILMAPFFQFLAEQFGLYQSFELLDVGCGNGLNLRMMIEQGHHATGIDFSPRMVGLARRTAPGAKVRLGNFLDMELPSNYFHGVFAKAIIHLFPKSEVGKFLDRVRSTLRPNGVFYVATTAELNAEDAAFAAKMDYIGTPVRYRSRWTADELHSALTKHGFKIRLERLDSEPARNKTWINFWSTMVDR